MYQEILVLLDEFQFYSNTEYQKILVFFVAGAVLAASPLAGVIVEPEF